MIVAGGGGPPGIMPYAVCGENIPCVVADVDLPSLGPLVGSLVQYAERATTAEAQVSDLESRLAALEMANQNPPTHMALKARE